MYTGYNIANESWQSPFQINKCHCVSYLLNAIKPLMSKPFPFKYKSTRARVWKKKKSAEIGYLIWLAAIGLSGAFLKSMQSMQFIPARVADRVVCIWCTFSFQQHSLLQFESLQNLVIGLAESLSCS